MNNLEIIGISTCGTYPSWLQHTIASFYNHVDKIVVVNGGYDINDPEKTPVIPLEREQYQVKQIDIHKKIKHTAPTKETLNEILNTLCIKNKDETGRATNMTLANQIANLSFNINTPPKKRWILKLDSDQILYKITRQELENLITKHPNKTGFRFAQYADYYHDFQHIGALPDEFTNDGSLFYLSQKNQSYCGQGSPGRIKVDQYPIYTIKTSHMRRINPSDVEPYEYHFKRFWYHTFGPNSINEHDYNRKTGKKLTLEQIKEIAHKETISLLRNKGNNIKNLPEDERIPYEPPLVCKMTPLEYIKKGY